MSITAFSGPQVVFGQSPFNPNEYNPELGTSAFYAGAGVLDPRTPYTYLNGQNFGAFTGAFLGFDNISTLNVVPYTASTTAIVNAQTNGSSSATFTLPLVSSASTTTGVSIITSITRADTGVADTNGTSGFVGIDTYTSVSGYISNGTSGTAGNILIVSTASYAPLAIGMVISGTGIAAGTTITGYGPAVNVTNGGPGVGFTGSYTVSGAAVAAGTSGSPITITASLNNTANAILAGGIAQGQSGTINLWNPQSIMGRCLTYTTSNASSTYTTATASGYDVYGYPMVEQVTLTAGSTVTGKKAFKYVKSVVLSGGSADTTYSYSVGTSTILGLPLRADSFGEVLVNAGNSLTALTLITAATGFTAADKTYPTATTGDVRGTIDFGSSGVNQAPTTNSKRFVVRQSPQPYNISSVLGLFGNTQYTNF
jgi:hypothetical protein